jgi:hypothetical protein
VNAEATYRERAREQADVFEAKLARNGPGSQTSAGRFDALLVRTDTPIEKVLAALIDFARPALEHSELPDELWSWVAEIPGWHVVFYGGSPESRQWIEGEHLVERIGDLTSYVHIEHDQKRPAFDRVLMVQEDFKVICRDENDFERAPDVAAKQLHRRDPWRLLEELTGVGLLALRAAIASAKPVYLICRHCIVLRGVEPNRIAVRRPVPPAPAIPELDQLFEQAESGWSAEVESQLFGYARAVADRGLDLVPRLLSMLRQKSPRPRSSRIALSALGMLQAEEAAQELVSWTGKSSAVLRGAAIGALAMLEQRARPALSEGAKSRKAAVKSACQGLLRVLDDPRLQALRDLRVARESAPTASKMRLASADLFSILATDLDYQARLDERARLIREGGAGLAAHVFALRLTHFGRNPNGMLLSYEELLDLVADDPAAPWVLPLVLLEMPFGDSMFHNVASQKTLVSHAKKRFGAPFNTALRLIRAVGASE